MKPEKGSNPRVHRAIGHLGRHGTAAKDSISQHTYFISGNTAINTLESMFGLFFVHIPSSPPARRPPSTCQPSSFEDAVEAKEGGTLSE